VVAVSFFDFEMLGGAIVNQQMETKPISANDLLRQERCTAPDART
jgi:hypothetical protein